MGIRIPVVKTSKRRSHAGGLDLSPQFNPDQLELRFPGVPTRIDERADLVRPKVQGSSWDADVLANAVANTRFSDEVLKHGMPDVLKFEHPSQMPEGRSGDYVESATTGRDRIRVRKDEPPLGDYSTPEKAAASKAAAAAASKAIAEKRISVITHEVFHKNDPAHRQAIPKGDVDDRAVQRAAREGFAMGGQMAHERERFRASGVQGYRTRYQNPGHWGPREDIYEDAVTEGMGGRRLRSRAASFTDAYVEGVSPTRRPNPSTRKLPPMGSLSDGTLWMQGTLF